MWQGDDEEAGSKQEEGARVSTRSKKQEGDRKRESKKNEVRRMRQLE